MASVPQIVSIEEYLVPNGERDLEFVGGRAVRRTGVDARHGLVQAALLSWFFAHRAEWGIRPLLGYRAKTSPTCVRRSDICLVRSGEPVERVLVRAPLLCIEVLAFGDELSEVLQRLDEFVAMGTENIWILDPSDRSAATYSRFGMQPARGTRLEIAETPIYLDVPEIFATLDEQAP